MARSIRVDKKTYRKLAEETGRLQTKMGRRVSLDETIWYLLKQPRESNRITDLAGTWDVSAEEARDIEDSLRMGWRRWRIKQHA